MKKNLISSVSGSGAELTPEPSPTESMTEAAYNQIEAMIVTGELEPGSWVTEVQLCERSKFGRAPVRAALQRLTQQGLISTQPRRGAQICPIDFRQQFRALELRRAVERLLAGFAAQRATPAQREKFRELAESFLLVAENENQDLSLELDREAYQLMLKAADNPFVGQAMTSVKGLSRRFWLLYRETHGNLKTVALCERAVLLSVAQGDVEQAEKAADAFMDYIEEFTLAVIGYQR